MRPITSGVGSAPHRLAKHLARALTKCLGKMSPTHLKNSADLLEKLKGVNHKEKKMVSFDVKSLWHQCLGRGSDASLEGGAGSGGGRGSPGS